MQKRISWPEIPSVGCSFTQKMNHSVWRSSQVLSLPVHVVAVCVICKFSLSHCVVCKIQLIQGSA